MIKNIIKFLSPSFCCSPLENTKQGIITKVFRLLANTIRWNYSCLNVATRGSHLIVAQTLFRYAPNASNEAQRHLINVEISCLHIVSVENCAVP